MSKSNVTEMEQDTGIVKTATDSDEAGVIDTLKLAFVADPFVSKGYQGKQWWTN